MENEVIEGKAASEPEAGSPAPAPVSKKVAIVGCSDSKNLAPYADTSWEVWAMNNAFSHVTRRTAWFEIHPVKQLPNGQFMRRKLLRPGVFEWSNEFRGMPMREYMASLASLGCPVYMQRHWDAIPNSIPFPLEEVTRKFGRYFTNSVSYMICLAILQGATEIGCYGVDMSAATEYGPQRPSCEYFLGIAAGLGIKLHIPPQADLLKTRFLYGFEEREQVAWEAKMQQMLDSMEQRKQKALATAQQSQKQIDQYIGAQEAIRETQRVWSNLNDAKVWIDPY